ncbi:MAG: hypothetical protein PUC47_06175 [Oscillospiraceae bacterium]|nr:hypothetical protein [Oscillospiraceae bacterium]
MKEIAIVYGADTGVQKKALELLTRFLLDAMGKYPACFPAGAYGGEDFRCIYIGTRDNNSFLRTLQRPPLTREESFRILVEPDCVFIEGFDDNGVLYGCVDFHDRYLALQKMTHDSERYFQNVLEMDRLPSFELVSSPSIRHRGLWTWGHVIYDYKGYLDHMARLKMNEIVIWNDFAPVNGADVTAYAHSCGIKVFWGYSWFWDVDCKATDIQAALSSVSSVLEKYEQDYLPLNGDGIYFQSFTELNEDQIGGICVAEAVTELVNRASALFFDKYPDLELQFGLHADSVREKLDFIAKTDPRVRIIWENCGAFPFSYIPTDVERFPETYEFVREITHLRGKEERFGAVTKGFTKLDWSAFEHQQGPFFIGTSSKAMQQNRIDRKRPIWRYIQACWLTHADKAREMVQLISRETDGDTHITALVEDGMFDRQLLYPVALYAEMLWNCNRDISELMYEVALRDDVEFA